MRRSLISGGWYCDALPNGAYAVLLKDRYILTDQGEVSLPPGGNLLNLRLAPDGVRFAGIGHQDDQAWLWDGTRWSSHGTAHGTRSVIFDRHGTLHTVPGPGTPAGSIGFRYVAGDGRIVYSHETYADPVRGLYEYTERGGIVIGQAGKGPLGEDPCIAHILATGAQHLIEAGTCRFINYTAEGPRIALAFVREDLSAAVLIWMTADEIPRLPAYTRFVEPPPPPPVTPPPTPEPVMSVPDESAFATSFLNTRLVRFDGDEERTREHSFGVLNLLALELHRKDRRWGLLEKKGGARVRDRAADVLAYDLGNGTAQLLDVIADGEGHDGMPRGTWGLIGEDHAGIRPIAQWKPPYQDTAPQPEPDEDEDEQGEHQPHPSGEIAALRAELNATNHLVRTLADAVQSLKHVALKSAHGKYLSVQPDGSIVADRDDARSWETLTLESMD